MPAQNRPLLPTASEQAGYLRRPAIDDAMERAVDRGRNLLVVGEVGSGKTTALHHLVFKLAEDEIPVAYCNLLPARTLLDAIALLRDALEDVIELNPLRERLAAAARVGDQDPVTLVELVRALGGGPSDLRVLLDDPNADIAFDLFGRLRDDVWQLGYSWVVAASPQVAAALSRPPADAFFERRVELFGLNAIERRELLRLREPGIDITALYGLVEHGPDSPRALISAVDNIREVGPARYVEGLAARESKAAMLGRAAAMLVAEMEALGAVSASDELLLRRLGWTKQRASKVLNQLEEVGLVRSFSLREGSGRPRRMFELRPPEDFA